MPTYEYVCGKCEEHFEVYQSFSEAPLKRHNGGCGGKLTKVLSPVGIVLKGGGFYKTDSTDSARSRSKSKAKAGEGSGSSSTTSTGSDKGSSTKGSGDKGSGSTSSGGSSTSSGSTSSAA